MIVTLTPEEMLGAVIVGARRMIVSMQASLANVAGRERKWDDEIEGAMAEAALARETGRFFDPRVGRYGAKDVGDFHVRHTSLTDGCLIIRERDPDGRYVLITGSLGNYRIAGWIDSARAKEMDDCRRAPNGRPAAWFIPQKRLDPL